MTRQAVTVWQTETVNELTEYTGVVEACRLVGRSRATHHRQANPTPRMHGPHPKPQHPAELTTGERAEVLTLLTSDECAEMSCHQVWARELDAGKYWCSPRTMYRILSAAEMGGERRRQAAHPPRDPRARRD